MKSNSKTLGKANPLNLKDNYNDNVLAFKILLNLSDNDNLKLLGQQIVDSFMLLSIIQNNKMLSKNISCYNELIEKLSNTVNKYSKFEKLLRTNKVKTKGFLSDKFLFNTDINNSFQFVSVNSLKAIKSNKSYIVINKESYDYSLNDILQYSNLFKRVICKDKEKVFEKQINDNKLSIKNIKLSLNTNNIVRRKNRLLKKTISSNQNISNSQFLLFDRINNLYKKLVFLEYQIQMFEKCNSIFNSRLLFLEYEVVDLYKQFLDECNDIFNKSIRERNFVYENLNSFLSEYELLMNDTPKEVETYNSPLVYNTDLNKERKNMIKSYILDRINNSDGNHISFINYLKNNSDNKDLIDQEQKNNNEYLAMFSSYLIYKSGVTNEENVISFDKFVNDIYGVEKIDPIYNLKI